MNWYRAPLPDILAQAAQVRPLELVRVVAPRCVLVDGEREVLVHHHEIEIGGSGGGNALRYTERLLSEIGAVEWNENPADYGHGRVSSGTARRTPELTMSLYAWKATPSVVIPEGPSRGPPDAAQTRSGPSAMSATSAAKSGSAFSPHTVRRCPN
jgi:hypothetical protein